MWKESAALGSYDSPAIDSSLDAVSHIVSDIAPLLTADAAASSTVSTTDAADAAAIAASVLNQVASSDLVKESDVSKYIYKL